VRLLHVIPSLAQDTGGPARALMALATAQARAGAGVTVVTTTRREESRLPIDVACGAGVRFVFVGPCYGPLLWRPGMAAIVRRAVEESDVVHIHALFEAVQHCAALWARRLGRPYIIRPAGMLDSWSMRQSALRKRLYMAWRLRDMLRCAAAIHFTAEGERVAAARWTSELRAIVEPNGLDFSEFDRLPRRDASSAPAIRDTAPNVIFMSRVHHKKGLDLLIDALARARTRPIATIVGSGSPLYVAELERLAERVGVRDRLEFRGGIYGEERLRLLRDADLFVLPSRQENFGVAIVEALAAGTPVVVSKAVNIWEEIVAAGVGVAVDLDPQSLADAIDGWLGTKARSADIGERAVAFARARYDAAAVARRWIGHYANILGEAMSPDAASAI